MKKYFAVLMTVLFLGSTTGLVLAQDAAATPVAKKAHKKHHHKKPAAAAMSATPAAK
jgi:hypothetical protein